MSKLGFEFPLDSSGQWDGFNDSGIEHFLGDPFEYLGREVTQNALDAAVSAPCRLVVSRLDVDRKEIPDWKGLQKAIAVCLAGAEAEGPKAAAFFDLASKTLSQDKVSVLQFSDFNTKGVQGPCENGFPFFALMKASGQSKKDTGTATGSFGIGKYAPYTVSEMRTVFVSTAFTNAEDEVSHYTQGKAILMSHDGSKGRHRGTGFWGVRSGCLPLIDREEELPAWLRRPLAADGFAVDGTTLSILGFRPIKNWSPILAASIAESFFGAICRDKLQVDIAGTIGLSAPTLSAFFSDATVVEAISGQDGEPDRLKNAANYYRTLTSPESIVENHQNTNLGHCRLYIHVAEGLPKKVAILRNGMLITDELTGLRRFGDFKEFAAVVECLDDDGNALLRDMEPPAHDDFRHVRLPPDKQQAGRVGLADLAKWVREMLKRHARDSVADVTSLEELADFFGDEEAADATGGKGEEENPRGKLSIRARPVKRKASTLVTYDTETVGDAGQGETGDLNDSGPGGEGKAGSGGGGGDGENTGSGGKDSDGGGSGGQGKTTATVPIRNVRALVRGPRHRRIAFTPDVAGTMSVELEDSGADTNRFLRILQTSLGVLDDGRISAVVASPGVRIMIDVTLEREFLGTVRIKTNAI